MHYFCIKLVYFLIHGYKLDFFVWYFLHQDKKHIPVCVLQYLHDCVTFIAYNTQNNITFFIAHYLRPVTILNSKYPMLGLKTLVTPFLLYGVYMQLTDRSIHRISQFTFFLSSFVSLTLVTGYTPT